MNASIDVPGAGRADGARHGPQASRGQADARGSTANTAPKSAPKSASAPESAAPVLETDDQKTVYALGLQVYRSLAEFELSPAEMELVKRALADAAPVSRRWM